MAYGLLFTDFYISGGASNADISASLGGVKSSKKVYGQSAYFVDVPPSRMMGVTIDGANGNDVGIGILRVIVYSGYNLFSWAQPGVANPATNVTVTALRNTGEISVNIACDPEDAGVNSLYPLLNPEGTITLTIDTDNMSTLSGVATANVVIENILGNLFPAVTQQEAEDGLTKYRGIYLEISPAMIPDIVNSVRLLPVFIQNSLATDTIEIGWSDEGINSEMELLPDENTTPTGVAFFGGVEELEQHEVNFAESQYHGLWIKQVVPPQNPQSAENSSVILGVRELTEPSGADDQRRYSILNLNYKVWDTTLSYYELLALSGKNTPCISYVMVLTGAEDSLSDYLIKATKFRFTKYGRIATDEDTVIISVQESTLNTDEIFARPNGNLKITQTIKYTETVERTQILVDLPFRSVILSKGGRSRTHVISGFGIVDYSDAVLIGTKIPREISGKLINDGTVTLTLVTPESAMYLPNSTINVDGESVDIHTVEVSVHPTGVTTRLYR